VNVTAGHDGIDINSQAKGEGFGLSVSHDGQVFDNVSLGTYVTVEEGAGILGNQILIEAAGGDSADRVRQRTINNAGGLDFATDDYVLNVSSDAEVDFRGRIGSGVRNAQLFINEAGEITSKLFVDAHQEGGEIIFDRLNASAIPTAVIIRALDPTIKVDYDPDNRPYILGIASGDPYGPDSNEQHGRVKIGDDATIGQADRFNSVEVINRSTKDLQIDDMNVLYTGLPGPVLTIQGGTVTGAFDDVAPERFGPTRIEMVSWNTNVSLFGSDDVLDFPSLAGQLKSGTRAIDAWLKGQLKTDTQTALTSYSGTGAVADVLQAKLVRDLGTILSGPSIYQAARFTGVTLRSETNTLRQQNPQGADLIRLNRLLLEDAFAAELSREYPTSDFEINGVINNPTGSTKIINHGGSILLTDPAGHITTSSLIMESDRGSVGLANERIGITIFQDDGLLPAPRLEVRAFDQVGLDIDAAGTPGVEQMVLNGLVSQIGDIFAGFGGLDLVVTEAISAPGRIELTGLGDMIDAYEGEFDFLADTLYLQGTGSVGHFVVESNGDITDTYNAFEAQINGLEANIGSLYLRNDHSLTVGDVYASNTGIQATGVVDVQLPGIMSVNEDVIANGDVILGAFDVEATQDSVLMANGTTIQSVTGDVTLLNGDVFTYNSTHRLKAAGLLTIAMDQGNVDGGVGVTFTTPDTANRDIIQANELLIVTGPDRDTIIIPDLYIPTRYEGGAEFDIVRVNLVDAPNSRTTLKNIDVENITFTTEVTADWLIDTTQTAQVYGLFEWDILSGQPTPPPSITVENSFLASGGIRVVQNTHSNADSFKAMVGDYFFTDGAERLDVLQLDHVVNAYLKGGSDMLKVGGIRQATVGGAPRAEVAPFQVSQFLTVDAGDGTDAFLLEDPRTGSEVPSGRLGATADGDGIVANYQIEGAPTIEKAIIFKKFESVTVNLGQTDGIFVIEDTVLPTVVNLDAVEDPIDNASGQFGNDVISVFKITENLTINGERGDDDFNIIGTGPGALVIDGGLHDKSLDLPTGGDRIRYGATRTFDGNLINVLDAKNAIKLFGTGWETGDQVIFTSDGTAPAILASDGVTRTTLQSGGVYYIVRQGRDIIRLTDSKEKADAIAAYLRDFTLPDDGLYPDLITILDGGRGNHQLTLARNGEPLLKQTVGGLIDGENGNPSRLVFNNPGTEQTFTADSGTNTITVADASGLQNGQKLAFFAEAELPAGLKGEIFYTITNLNAGAGTFQIVDPDPLPLAAPGSVLGLTTATGTGQAFVTTLGLADFSDIEKLNILLGLGNDTWVVDNENSALQTQISGGPSDDEIVVHRMGNNTVIQGDQGDEDTLRVIVNDMPQVEQFSRLVVGAGIERLSVDNTDNPAAMEWFISLGSLYFGNGNGTATVSQDNSFTVTSFVSADPSAVPAPLAVGDRLLVSTVTVAITNPTGTAYDLDVVRDGDLPKYAPEDLPNGGSSPFSSEDFIDFPSIAAQLKTGGRPIDIYLSGRLLTDTRAALAAYSGTGDVSEALQTGLVRDFNLIISGASVYDASRFAGIVLNPATETLRLQNPQEGDLVRLNRLLIEDAYPQALSSSSRVQLDQSQFYYVTSVNGNKFELALTYED
ncbi:MAG: hypothetical protein WBE58_11760, partial [Verrucomicrobiales bacterium]